MFLLRPSRFQDIALNDEKEGEQDRSSLLVLVRASTVGVELSGPGSLNHLQYLTFVPQLKL